MKNGKFLAGVIAGLGTGALLGLLFAPDKGSSTRKKLMNRCTGKVEREKQILHNIIRKNKEKLQHEHSNDGVSHV